MLFCETAGTNRGDVEDLSIFASQLSALGVAARIDVRSVPENLGHNLQFDVAPRLADGGMRPGDGLALIAADQLSDAGLVRLRRLAGGTDLTVHAFGNFASREVALGVRARLAYVFGREPALRDVPCGESGARVPATVFGVPRGHGSGSRDGAPRRVLLVGPDLKDPLQGAALLAFAARRSFRVVVVTDSKSKQAWIATHGQALPVFHYGEVLPLALAGQADVAVFIGGIGRSYRLQTLAANLLVSGVPLLDGSSGRGLAEGNDAFIAGPPGIVGLDGFLEAEILPNFGQIAAHVRESRAAAAASPAPVLDFLEVAPEAEEPRRSRRARPAEGGIVFVPTNGIGLGHAQRCAIVASALASPRPRPVFAAFPSCTRMVKSYGFHVMPLIGRSTFHAQSHEHDLANYLRLRALAAGARTLVFDGGYVFDSVYRTVLEGDVRGIWIRRGLWQEGQNNSVALDREKCFERVIVPGEAFEELNATYSQGGHLHPVGPIVQEVRLDAGARADLRARLAERYDRPVERLVVSMLGAGVAADRRMQIQALSSLFERRSDTLHLVVVWPSATLEPGWFAWRNTRVVRTQHAAALAAASDLAVTASGYNSFHEALYNRVAAIFVPQLAPSTDDQHARARAACDRGLAAMLEASELMTLERLVVRYLDSGEADAMRARLAAADLPPPGTRRAAELIEEVTHGPDALERDPVADRSARRR